jgi:hypothetical protein
LGIQLQTTQPILTVGNAAGGSGTRTYQFEVSEDDSFGNPSASQNGVAEGEDGTTSWQVSPALESGKSYVWRVRATASGQSGAYSDVGNFSIRDAFSVNRPTGGLVVYDPLTAGSSVAMEVVGGRFIPQQGWQVVSSSDYIRYQVPQMDSGFVEFDVTNIREPNPVPGKRMLLSMWDPTKGTYRENPFRVHLQKLDRNTVSRWDVRLRWISRGQETNTGVSFFDFEADIVYPWRLEWGTYPGFPAQQARVILEGLQIMERNYDKPYRPATFWIELGNQERAESLEEAIFSNVRIGSR